jgi:hypothetical protein
MDKLITSIYEQDLNGIDVNYLTKGKAIMLLYKDLLKFDSILDAFGSVNNIILLFPVQNDTMGHWICIRRNNSKKLIRHWDSYGLSWEQERGYTSNKYVKQNILGDLYAKLPSQGWRVDWNKYKLQQMADNINTCGRFACMRARLDYLDNDEFANLFLHQKMSPDWYITCLTFVALNQDEKDEENIIKTLSK